MTTANPQHVRSAGTAGRVWQGFRHWRRTRPFWGGLFTALAGVEMFGSTQMSLAGLTLKLGPTGFLGWLIPTILVTCGMLMWFSPAQRLFYSIVAAVTVVYSVLGLNLGGFFVGLLLGLVGSALGFAWAPVTDPRPAAGADPAPAPHADPGASPDLPGSRDPRLYAVTLVALSLSAGGLLAVHAPTPVGAAPACPTTSSPAGPSAPATRSASPSASASASPSASPTRNGNVLTDILDGIGDLFRGGHSDRAAGAPASPTPTPIARPAGTATPSGSPAAGRKPAGGTRSGACPTRTPSTPGKVEPGRSLPRIAADPGQPKVAEKPSKLTGSKVTMTGLRFDGIVELPTANGTLKALKFSMARAVTDDFKLVADGSAGRNQQYVTDRLTVQGDVAFYSTRFVGRLLGITITLTPDLPFPAGIPVTSPIPITFTDPVIDLAFVTSDTLTARPTLKLALA
ncbi:DUF6114 domain-containing protein [Micromonospora sp. RTP1Z1]|uniref:DUF6114 domain-containing protein n=1 Tax=Micromonospora sp. RTP1Z1 TaxID=2994043 RepID=UPI0029C7A63F|nr:DUF6114 domain-containing protein [Micromonospora sp. RTP1Z1]